MPSYISMELSFYYHIFLGTSIAEFFVCCWSCLGCMSCTKLHWWCCGHLERLLRYCGIGISENLKSGCHCLTSTVTWLQKELLTERSLCKWHLGITIIYSTSLTIDAFREMVWDMAVLVLATGSNDTGVDALAVLASLLCRALTVCPTTNTCRRELGIYKNENRCHAVSHFLSKQLSVLELIHNQQ